MFSKKLIDIRNHIILKFCSRDIDICFGIKAISIRRRCVTRSRIIVTLSYITQTVHISCIRRAVRVLTAARIRLRRSRLNRLCRTTIYVRKLDTFYVFQIANQNDCYLSTSCGSTGAQGRVTGAADHLVGNSPREAIDCIGCNLSSIIELCQCRGVRCGSAGYVIQDGHHLLTGQLVVGAKCAVGIAAGHALLACPSHSLCVPLRTI